MKLKIELKPKTYFKTAVWTGSMYDPVSSTAKETLNGIMYNHYRSSSKYWSNALVPIKRYDDSETVRVYSLEKRRKKVQLVTDPKLLKRGIKRKIVSPSYWIVTYYDIPAKLLELAKLRVVQGQRTWKFEALK